MAKLLYNKYVLVEKGDTLSQIAKTYASKSGNKTYRQLAALNGITNPDLIYVNQRIYLNKEDLPDYLKETIQSAIDAPIPTIKQFGLSVDPTASDTLFATWTWNAMLGEVDKYTVRWRVYTVDNYWENTDVDTTDMYNKFKIPSNAVKIRFQVKAIPKKVKKVKNGKTVEVDSFSAARADWATKWKTPNSLSEVLCEHKHVPPVEVPSNLTVKLDGFTLTAEVTNISSGIDIAEFQVVKNDSTVCETKKVKVTTGSASYSYKVLPGAKYKVRFRVYRNDVESEWSNYSSNSDTPPAAPSKFTKCEPQNGDPVSIYLEWGKVDNADSYTIEYTTKKSYFDGSDQVTSKEGIPTTSCTLTSGIETGKEYFFRVRAVNSRGTSDWSEISSTIIGKPPAAPTTWSSATSVISGQEPLTLYWVHNSEDSSTQTAAHLEVYVDYVKVVDEKFEYDSNEPDKTRSYHVKMVSETGAVLYPDGAKLTWRVRTAGISGYGDWSILRTVDIYAPPTLELELTDSAGDLLGSVVHYRVSYEAAYGAYVPTTEKLNILSGSKLVGTYTTTDEQVFVATVDDSNIYYIERTLDVLTALPLRILATAGPNPQEPIGYHVAVTANEPYETVDRVGNTLVVNEGGLIYAKHFDISGPLSIELSAGDINFKDGVSYTINVTVSMDSGLTAEASSRVMVLWSSKLYTPGIDIEIDTNNYSTQLRPYCVDRKVTGYRVENSSGTYFTTTEKLDFMYGQALKNVTTDTGDQVYYGATPDIAEVYFCIKVEERRITDVTLAVYRHEFDGSFTEIASGLDGAKNTYVTDPHPSLDYARYRVVATSKTTGSVSFYDMPAYEVGVKSAIIQWDEAWSSFEVSDNYDSDIVDRSSWEGSLLELPYNIDVSNNHDVDTVLVEYIGREHPVGYYGTQLGETATWNMVIPKEDKETLYALRRLAIWRGDVYVREPSGSGYWASVKVSYSQKHMELTIPITLDITRVEGGA